MTFLLVLQLAIPLFKPLASESILQPQNVQAVEYTPANVRITWESVTGARTYKVYEILDEGLKQISEVSSTTAYARNLSEGEHVFAISAVTTTSESSLSDNVTVSINYPEMQSPEGLSAKVLYGNDLRLSWSEAENATLYNLYQVKNGERTFVENIDGTYYSKFRNMPAGEYTFEVTSVHPLFGESNVPSQITYKLIHPIMQPPANLGIRILNGNDIRFSWEESDFASGYNIYRIIDGHKELYQKVEGSSTGPTLRNLPEGIYDFEVTSYSDRFGESETSSKISHNLIYPEMQPPTNLSMKVTNGNDLRLSWEASDYATGYSVYQIINDQKEFIETITGSTTISFRNMPDGLYEYEVTSYSERFGESKDVSNLSYQLENIIMEPPADLSTRILNGNDIRLSWTESKYATGYNIYQVNNGQKDLVTTVTSTSYTTKNLPEGFYEYEVTSSSDRFGESPVSSKISYQLTHPIMQAPTGVKSRIINGDSINISWTDAAFAKGYNVFKVIDGQREFVRSVEGTTSVTVKLMPEGEHTFEVSSYSDRFGESVESGSTTITLVYPEVVAPVLKLKSLVGQTATLSWNSIDGIGTYNVYEFKDGVGSFIGMTDKTSYSITDITDGKHHYVITALHDRFGESAYSNEVLVEVQTDKVPPVTTSNISTDWVNSNFGLQLIAEDDKSGVNKTYYSINNEPFVEGTATSISKEGTHGVSFYSTDKAGNVELTKSETVKVDKTAPVTSGDLASGIYKDVKTLNLSAVDNLSGVKSIYYSVDGSEFTEGTKIELTEGVKKVSFYSVDVAGNEEEVQAIVFTIDEQAPVTVSDIEEKWNKESVNVELTATDNLSGVAQTYYSIDGIEFVEGTKFTVSGNGIHQVAFYSVDNAGNVEEIQTQTVKIDGDAPVTSSNIKEGWVSRGFIVSLVAEDQLSGVDKTYYSIDGTDFTEGSSVKFPEDGNYEVSYYSTDVAGNSEEVKLESVKVDNQAPITVSNLENKWYQDSVEVKLTATDNLSGVADTYYSVNGYEFTKGTTLTIEQKGNYVISYYSVDKAGNEEEVKTEEVNMDSQAPVTTSNIEDKWYQQGLKVELKATDDFSGVADTFYSVDGADFVKGTEFFLKADGVYEVTYYSIDNAGNKEEVVKQTVKVDGQAPETTDNISDIWYKNDVEVVLNAQENLSGVNKTFYSVNGSDFVEGSNLVVTEEGTNKVSYYSVDVAGNKEETKSPYVKIDKSVPTIVADVNEEYSLGSEFEISYTAEDQYSGVASEEVTLNGVTYQNGDTVTFDQPGVYILTIKVTDHAGWTTTFEKEFVVYIPVSLEVLPKVIKGNKGIFTVKANLLNEFAGSAFEVSTATLNGVAPKLDNNGLTKQAEKGHFKFEREDFYWKTGKVELEFRAYLENGFLVVGKTIVDVK